jgi:Protein of unknown function (DUF1648)
MIRDWYKSLVLLMWIALPINALNYWRVWDQLPARMAVHFDANWQPNGYTSREGAVMLGMGILATMLVIFTIAMLASRALKPSSSWPVLIISYFVLGVIWYANSTIVDFNLKAQPRQSQLVGSELENQNPHFSQNQREVGHPTNVLSGLVTGRAYV